MKHVIIVGGGIAGLTAGVLLQKKGIQTELFEKNAVAGGQCMGWEREGCYIDNCIHWLTGTKEGTPLNELWKEVGALGDGVELYEKPAFFSSERNGEKITFWRDKERTRRELIALSPEDAMEINKLIDYVKIAESSTIPTEKPFDAMSVLDYMRLGMSMKGMMSVMKEYGKMDIYELAERFHHPLIQRAICDYMPDGYQAYAFLVSYATITSGNGDIPRGGSLQMVRRMVDKYVACGGTLHTSSPVDHVKINGKKAEGVVLSNQKFIAGDGVILTCDTDFTFHHLLPEQYMPKGLKMEYRETEKYPVTSGFQVAYAVQGVFPELSGTRIFPCTELEIGKSRACCMSTNSYDYEPDFAPEGETILQTNIVQTEEDYKYWKALYQNRELYNKKKAELSEKLMTRLVNQYPFLQGKIRVIDVWTPVTYERYCHSYKGAYMSFTVTRGAKNVRVPNKIKGLHNVFLGSQWQMGPGGLPTALAMGKFAAWHVMNLK